MNDRRTFLRQAAAVTLLASGRAPRAAWARAAEPASKTAQGDHQGWKATSIKQSDGKQGWVLRPAQVQFLHYSDGKTPYYDRKFSQLIPFGVAQMDNGEVALIGAWADESKKSQPVIAFSENGGNLWTPFKNIESADCHGRPMMLTDLGGGQLMFQTEAKPSRQFFSSDYGRTWPESRPLQLASNGLKFNVEGSALVDRDAAGLAKRIASIGFSYTRTRRFPKDPAVAMLRWSDDGGRNWINETQPGWGWREEYQGKTIQHGTGEGSIARARNGWLVAALRTDMAAEFYPYHNDNLMGVGVSVSKDDGRTWTPMQRLYEAGRMHTHLIVMPGGEIVLTHIMRQDVKGGRLVSYGRGAGAVVSYDNGLTWDMAHRYLLGDFEFADGTPFALACGHQWSALLDDGYLLTVFGHYSSKGACLIKWKPVLS